MATLWNNQRKVAFFIFLVFVSIFISIQLFAGLSSMLGAVLLGFLINKKWVEFVVVLAAYIGAVNFADLLGVNAFYPLVFLIVTYLIFSLFKTIDKGTLFFWVTLILSALFLLAMWYMEIKTGYVTQTLNGAKAEIISMSQSLKDVMTQKEMTEYLNYAQRLLERYYIFFALLQVLLFTFLNLLLMPYLFEGLPETFAQSFYKLKIPYYGIWGINIGLIFYMFLKGSLSNYGINAVLFFLAIYFFQGLSLSSAFFKKFSVPFYISAVFITLFLINQAMWLLISIAGIVDSQFNIKKFLKEA